jgi:cell division protein FtsB
MGTVPEVALMVLRRPAVLVMTLLFILIGAAFLTQVVPYRQIIDSQRRVETSREQLIALEEENKLLQADVAALLTDEEIEKLAREKLGYVKSGETAYVVLDPPAEDQPSAPVIEPDHVVLEKTWVDRVWDFVTGGDLAE